MQDLEQNAAQAANLMAMLASKPRLMILCRLLEGEFTVGSLVNDVGLSPSALSQHLAKLRGAGLVSTRREAQTIFYCLASDEAEAVLEVLERLYCDREIRKRAS